MRLVHVALMVAALAASPVFATDQPLMSLEDIRPGMRGYGLSVFSGTDVDRFEFTVRGVVPNFRISKTEVLPAVITVQLSGGPKRSDGSALFDKNLIFAGMSGSPMYIDGKLIGGLVSARDFSTAAQAAVTPIDLQLGLISLAHEGTVGPVTVAPGSYVSVCFVHGDGDQCVASTVTAAKDEHLVTTAHAIGIPYGTVALPVFEFPVADLMETQEDATKLSGKRGRPIGTAVAHGMYGFVVHEGDLPDTVPVVLSIGGVFSQPQTLRYRMAYHKAATAGLEFVMSTALARLPVNPEVAGLSVAIRLAHPAGTIQLVDSATMALQSMESVLDKLLDQEKGSLRIEGIDVRYFQMPELDVWSPVAIDIQGKENPGTLRLLARCSSNSALEQLSAPVDLQPLAAYRQLKTQWMDGTNLQDAVLSALTVREAMPLLAQMEDRDALYHVYIEDDSRIAIDRTATGAVVRRRPQVAIIMKQDFGDRRFSAPADKKIIFTQE